MMRKGFFAVAILGLVSVTTALGAQQTATVAAPAPAAAPDAALAAAKGAWERHPTNVDSIIWYGRRVGYTGAFQDAIAIYTKGLALHPDEPRLLRHRGHRYLSVRDFASARRDLERAREVVAGRPPEIEPDGRPNERNVPTGTLQSNIRYHLGLAYFYAGDLERARATWEEDARLSPTLDHRVSASVWWVITLANLGRHEEARSALAQIRADWDIIENGSYHRLLLWMKGELTEADLMAPVDTPTEQQTVGHAVGQWHRAHGRLVEARQAWERVLASGASASFGTIGSEIGLKSLTKP